MHNRHLCASSCGVCGKDARTRSVKRAHHFMRTILSEYYYYTRRGRERERDWHNTAQPEQTCTSHRHSFFGHIILHIIRQPTKPNANANTPANVRAFCARILGAPQCTMSSDGRLLRSLVGGVARRQQRTRQRHMDENRHERERDRATMREFLNATFYASVYPRDIASR